MSDSGNIELDKLSGMVGAARAVVSPKSVNKTVMPRDATSMVLLDRRHGDWHVLMGKRAETLKFMPGAMVFPGGSVDRSDGSVPALDDVHPQLATRIRNHLRGRGSDRRVKAIGLAGIREMQEEAGLLIGTDGVFPSNIKSWEPFANKGIRPSLGHLRLLARAITPPVMPRRFDTWFLLTTMQHVAHVPIGGFEPSGELEELRWVRPVDAMNEKTRDITRVILTDLMLRLKDDPELSPATPAPFYRYLHRRFRRFSM